MHEIAPFKKISRGEGGVACPEPLKKERRFAPRNTPSMRDVYFSPILPPHN